MIVDDAATRGGRRDRRHERHEATRQEILAAAWALMRSEGVPSLSLRALARVVGMEAQSLYSYFDSKRAIYDALFAEANTELLARTERYPQGDDARAALRHVFHVFVNFCTEDHARYQLLYQRSIPGFEPSEQSYALARQGLDAVRRLLAAAGYGEEAHLEVSTSVVSGLVAQQMANDPEGERFVRHLDEVIDMCLDRFEQQRRRR